MVSGTEGRPNTVCGQRRLARRFAGVPVMVCLQLATGHSEAGADHQDPNENRSQSTRRFHSASVTGVCPWVSTFRRLLCALALTPINPFATTLCRQAKKIRGENSQRIMLGSLHLWLRACPNWHHFGPSVASPGS
jgi:hypothetical protein